MADLNTSDKVFSITSNKTAIGTTELNAQFIKNPSGSGITTNLRNITIGNIHTVDGSWVRVRLYVNPTTSADGSALARNTLDIGSGKTATTTAFTTPTSSANGTQIFDFVVYSGQSFTYNFDDNVGLRPNNTLLITTVADAASRSAILNLVWDED